MLTEPQDFADLSEVLASASNRPQSPWRYSWSAAPSLIGRSPLSNELLLQAAKRSPAPRSWWEDEDDDPFEAAAE
jgi:hypothetical protein